MDRDYLQEALQTFNGGDWYGWKKEDSEGNVISNDQRMTYANIKIIKDGATLPTEAEVNAKIAEIKQAKTDKTTLKSSVKTKLLALGFTEDEITEAFGL